MRWEKIFFKVVVIVIIFFFLFVGVGVSVIIRIRFQSTRFFSDNSAFFLSFNINIISIVAEIVRVVIIGIIFLIILILLLLFFIIIFKIADVHGDVGFSFRGTATGSVRAIFAATATISDDDICMRPGAIQMTI